MIPSCFVFISVFRSLSLFSVELCVFCIVPFSLVLFDFVKALSDAVVLAISSCFNLEGFSGLESINARFVVLDATMGVHKRILEGNADAVEFCSTPAYYNLLAAASYTLIEGPTPTRVGGLYLFTLGDGADYNLQELQTIETSGVFDIKWRKPSPDLVPCLGQASADGSLRLYTLQDGKNM